MKTAEEILLDELNSIQATYLEEIPNFKQWVISAMKTYSIQVAKQALEDAVEGLVLIEDDFGSMGDIPSAILSTPILTP